MFGECFVYKKQPKILPAGDYTVTLRKPFVTTIGGYNVLRFPFNVEGEPSDIIPYSFDLFDVSDIRDTQQVERFCKNASKIKDCFKLEGNFSEDNFIKWEGKSGKVHIDKSNNGFMNVTKFYPAPEEGQSQEYIF